MASLTEIETARREVLARVRPLPSEDVPLSGARGRVLAKGISSEEAIPPFDNSAMDGYAVRAADTRGASGDRPARLFVVDESRAGYPARRRVGEGEAIAISTGAMVPAGSDAVVRLEDASRRDDELAVRAEVVPGWDIRLAGEDVEAGEPVLAAGAVLGPAEVGVLASLGQDPVTCGGRPRVAVLTTGDELVAPGEALAPGLIRNANAYSVPALATEAGAEVEAVDHVGDDAREVEERIAGMLSADVAVICGGVSVGEHDHVRPALERLGASEVFWGLALRPGRPTWFGTSREGSLVFGLPGNPVSAIVTFLLLVRPALWALAGASPKRRRGSAVLDTGYAKRPGRAHAIRVRLDDAPDGWHAEPTKAQGSHILTSMLEADALAWIPTTSSGIEPGGRVEFEWLR